MSSLLQQIFSGLAMGGIYACLGLALVMAYQSSHHVNFAQGEMAMFSTFVASLMLKAGLPWWAVFPLTVMFGFTTGFAIERMVLRPLKDAPEMSIIVVFVALYVGINAMAGWIFGHELQSFSSFFPADPPFGVTLFSAHELGTLSVMLAVACLLHAFMRGTRAGLAMRAAAEHPVSSRLAGIPVATMLSLGWGLAAAIGAIAGMLVAPVVFLDPQMMGGVLIYAFAAALLGGIDNPWGAVAGGLIIGVVENLAGTYVVGTELKLPMALALIVGVLCVRPSGLFGRKRIVKA